jgi:hypothetical protein
LNKLCVLDCLFGKGIAMSIADLPRDDAGNVQMQTDKEIATWVRHNSILRGMSIEEANSIDWIALIRRDENG